MAKPRLLDLFCCSGGSAVGYDRAGFEVVGVDSEEKPDYPFEFHRGDALEFLAAHADEFDAVHASPPCHDHSNLRTATGLDYGTGHLLGATLDALAALDVPFIVENVESVSVRREMARVTGNYAVLCGSHFGLELRHHGLLLQLRRHRLFATSFPFLMPPCSHRGEALDVTGHGVQGRIYKRRREQGVPVEGLEQRRRVMGIEWMTDRDDLAEAIPPAYTEFLGELLLADITEETAA